MRTSLLLLPLAALAFFLGMHAPATAEPGAVVIAPSEVQVFPFGILEGVRDPSRVVPMQVQAYNGSGEPIQLMGLSVRDGANQLIAQVDLLGERLMGDDGLISEAHFLMETLDPSLSHRYDHRLFIPLDQRPELTREQSGALMDRLFNKMRDVVAMDGSQLKNITFPVDLAELFSARSAPGDEVILDATVTWANAAGQISTSHSTSTVTFLAPYLLPPVSWGGARAGTWHAGDLHVHNCRDQSVGGCPSCAAESFNITGAFSNADLKPQYQALGMDWFSTTTHSYCINTVSEFNAVLSESQSLDDSSFALICGTELTILETGPQMGSDVFDTICFLNGNFDGRGIAHMGGHGMLSRRVGGDQNFLGACDDPIFSAMNNITAVNAEGGFTIANHPGGGGLWGGGLNFNSVADFKGMEKRKAVGSEIWNGTSWNGTAVHESWWIARLLEGKFTFPFSGSDTHDSAVDFGAAHVLLSGSLNDANLISSMMAGQYYLSNGPFLSVSIVGTKGQRKDTGGVVTVPGSKLPPNYPLVVEAPYNSGGDVGDVSVYQGTVGDSSEILLQTFSNVSGSGVLQVSTTIPTTGHSWWRTEFESSAGKKKAYSSLIILALL